MSLDDDRKKKELHITSAEAIASPNKRMELEQKIAKQEKQLAMLQRQIEREKVAATTDTRQGNEATGTGGMKKEEVLDAKATLNVKRQQRLEELKQQLQKEQRQSETPTKTA